MRKAIILLIYIFLLSTVLAKSAILDNGVIRVVTDPETSFSAGMRFTQVIQRENLMSDEKQMHMAFEFDSPLRDFKLEYLMPEQLVVAEKLFICPYDWDFNENVNPSPNKGQAICYEERNVYGDGNVLVGTEKFVLGNLSFNNKSVPELGWFFYDVQEIQSQHWVSWENNVEIGDRNGRTLYYTKTKKTAKQGEIDTWRITYEPDTLTGKWDYYTYLGNKKCLIDGDCIEVHHQDPFWSGHNVTYEYVITIDNTADGASTMDENTTHRVEVPNALLSLLNSPDGNDLFVVCDNGVTEMNRVFWKDGVTGFDNSGDLNVDFKYGPVAPGVTDTSCSIYAVADDYDDAMEDWMEVYMYAQNWGNGLNVDNNSGIYWITDVSVYAAADKKGTVKWDVGNSAMSSQIDYGRMDNGNLDLTGLKSGFHIEGNFMVTTKFGAANVQNGANTAGFGISSEETGNGGFIGFNTSYVAGACGGANWQSEGRWNDGGEQSDAQCIEREAGWSGMPTDYYLTIERLNADFTVRRSEDNIDYNSNFNQKTNYQSLLAQEIRLGAYMNNDSITPSQWQLYDWIVIKRVFEVMPTITLGEQQVQILLPDVNIIQPNVLGVMLAGGSSYTIDFNVQDGDSNTLLVDLNYSLSTTEGDGVEIINDMNTTGASITCDDSDFSDLTTCEYTWTVAGIDGNRFITVLVTDEAGGTSFDASDYNILIDNTIPVLSDPLPVSDFDINWATNIDANVAYTETNPFYCTVTPSINDVNSADENVSLSGGRCDYTYTDTLNCYDRIEFYFTMHDITEQSSTILQTGTMYYYCGPQSPDVNITQPNMLGTMLAGGSSYTIKFNVQDGDSNTLLVDLRYSQSTTEGDGVAIVDDMNTTGASITCDDSDFSDITNCEYTWTVAGIDGNRFITVLVADDLGTTRFDASDYNILIDNTIPVLSNPLPSFNFDINWATNIDANVDYTETNPFYCTVTPSVNDVNSADENASLSGGKCDYTYTDTLNCEDEIEFYFVMYDITEQSSAVLQTATMDYNCGVFDSAPAIITLTISPYVITMTSTLVINLDVNDNDYGTLTNTGYWQRSTDSLNFITFENAVITYSSSVGFLHTYTVGQPTLSTSPLAEGDFLRLRVTADDGVNATDTANSNTISYSEDITAIVNVSPVTDLNAINPSRSETDVSADDLISMFAGLIFGLGSSAIVFYLIMKIDIHPIKEILILLFLFTMGNFIGAFGTLMNIPILNNVTGFMLGMFLLVFWVGMWLLNS